MSPPIIFLQRLTHGKVDRLFAIKLPTIGIIPLPDPVVASLVSATNSRSLNPDRLEPALHPYEPGPLHPGATGSATLRAHEAGQSDFDFLTASRKKTDGTLYRPHARAKGVCSAIPVPDAGLFSERNASVGPIVNASSPLGSQPLGTFLASLPVSGSPRYNSSLSSS